MYKFKVFAAALALAGVPCTGASAFPMLGLAGSAAEPIQKARIVCEPFGRCFRVDAFGRRIIIPRREGFPGVGFERPPAERPGFPAGPGFQGGRGFGGPDAGQGRPGRGDEGEGRRNPDGSQGNQRGDQGQQQNGGQKHRPDANGGNGGNGGAGGQHPQQGGDQNRRRQPQQGNESQ